MNRKELKARAANVAAKCKNAYSFNRYASWTAVAAKLLDFGFNEIEAEAIMRSKWMRWAADANNARYGRVPAKAIIDMMPNISRAEVDMLVKETFG